MFSFGPEAHTKSPLQGGTMKGIRKFPVGSAFALGAGAVGESAHNCAIPECRQDLHVHEEILARPPVPSALFREPARDPWVAAFGVNLFELPRSEQPAGKLRRLPAAWYDSVETKLLEKIRHTFSGKSINTEASARNGETISVRLASEEWEPEQVQGFQTWPWEILEISRFSGIYEKPVAWFPPNKRVLLNQGRGLTV